MSDSPFRCPTADGPVHAVPRLPGSKSLTNRALMAAAVADGTSLLSGVLLAEDTQLMIDALRALGIAMTVDESSTMVEITGCGGQIPESEADLFCGNSGTTIRFLCGMLATGYGTYRLDGVQRMRERPIGALVDVLRALGARIEFHEQEGYPPLTIHGNGLTGGQVAFDRVDSSQMVSSLLMAAPMAGDDVMVDLRGPVVSRPYLTMTANVLDAFGVGVLSDFRPSGDHAKFIVPAPQRYQGCHYRIEPDASAATYFLALAAVTGGEARIEGLGLRSVQGDVGFARVLERMGCTVDFGDEEILLRGPEGGALRGIDVDLVDMPDTAQTLAVAALFADGPTMIRGIDNLRLKETDRLAALETELTRLGATVELSPGKLHITPPPAVRSAEIETYGDHRMAMSFALAGVRGAEVLIKDPGCCAKTYPAFFNEWSRVLGDAGRDA